LRDDTGFDKKFFYQKDKPISSGDRELHGAQRHTHLNSQSGQQVFIKTAVKLCALLTKLYCGFSSTTLKIPPFLINKNVSLLL